MKRRITRADILATLALVVAVVGIPGAAATTYIITSKSQIAPRVLAELRKESRRGVQRAEQGKEGREGLQGKMGEQGLEGKEGKQGPPAPYIPPSMVGPVGPAGPEGYRGATGPQGPTLFLKGCGLWNNSEPAKDGTGKLYYRAGNVVSFSDSANPAASGNYMSRAFANNVAPDASGAAEWREPAPAYVNPLEGAPGSPGCPSP